MNEVLRVLLLGAVGVAILLFGYVTLTVPMIAVTGPAVILIALCVGFVLIYRAKGSEKVQPDQSAL